MSCQLPTRAELALAAILAAGVLWLALVTWGPAALAVLRRGDTLTAILALVLAGVAGDLTRPLDLYELTVEQARQFDGVSVEAFLEAGCPADVGDGYTVVGGYEKDDGVSRSLILRGERHDIDPGDKLTVTGVLRVIEHDGYTVNGVEVPTWTEIRVEQFRPREARVRWTRGDGCGGARPVLACRWRRRLSRRGPHRQAEPAAGPRAPPAGYPDSPPGVARRPVSRVGLIQSSASSASAVSCFDFGH